MSNEPHTRKPVRRESLRLWLGRVGHAFGRMMELVWSFRGMRAARQALDCDDESTRHLAEAARQAAELAQRVSRRIEPLAEQRSPMLTCLLATESIRLSLVVVRRRDEGGRTMDGETPGPMSDRTITEDELAQLEPNSEFHELIRDGLSRSGLLAWHRLPLQELERRMGHLMRASQNAIEKVNLPRTRVENILVRRGLSALGLIALLGMGWWLTQLAESRHEVRKDLAHNRPWRTSSSWQTICPSPQQICPAGKDFFFHSREEASPWIEIDLEAEREFSGVRVDNRVDCCSERAVPLIIEVSRDRIHWQEVAKRTRTFTSFRARFERVSARWVRLRVAKPTILHLRRVRVLP